MSKASSRTNDAQPFAGPVRFGVFEVHSGELRRQGAKVKLQEQPFQLLLVLLERAGEIVSREELQGRLWPADTFVDFDRGLNRAVNKLREVLGDTSESPRWIETIPRRGYRFIAPVEVNHTLVHPSPAESPLVAQAESPVVAGRGLKPSTIWTLLLLLLLALGLSIAGLYQR